MTTPTATPAGPTVRPHHEGGSKLKKHIALAIAAVLSLALVAPVFAQPFADVPGEHWAFDAIAELAAKGILEGYPDGTFKGDRAMTRYEMAMALARILARIEAIKIPPPPKIPPPEVTRADMDRLTRLLNEFRAELSALGVRITALEEQIAAVKARLDNTYITGNWTYVYVTGGAPNPAQIFSSAFTTFGSPEVQRNRIRLNIRGRLSPEFQVFLRARWNSRHLDDHFSTTDFDRLRADWASPWFGMVFSVGREYWSLGPYGHLLFAETAREGMRVTGSFGGLAWTFLGFWNSGGPDSKTYGVRVELPAFAGWTFGVNYRRDQLLWTPTAIGNGSGFGVDWSGSLMGGLTLSGEYASWAPTGGCPTITDLFSGATAAGQGCTSLFVNLAINLGQFVGASQFAPMVNLYYKDIKAGYLFTAGSCSAPGFPATGATVCSDTNFVQQANWLGYYLLVAGQFWGADLSLTLSPKLSALVAYEGGTAYCGVDPSLAGGNNCFSSSRGARVSNLLARVTYTLSRNATAEVEYARRTDTIDAASITLSGAAFRIFFSW